MIKANFNTYGSYVTDSLYQWDINQVLTVTGLNLPVIPEMHFSNASMDKAIVRQARLTVSDNVTGFSVDIPNSLLQDPLPIHAHIGIYEGDTFKVVEKVEIPVRYRVRPADYRFEDTYGEIYSYKALENKIANINDTWVNKNAEQVGEFVNAWLDNHPEATTTVQNRSLTMDKLVVGTLGYVTPEMFGASVGVDATAPITQALATGKRVVFENAEYLVSDTITIPSDSVIEIKNATITSLATENKKYIFNIVDAENVKIYGKNATLKMQKPETAQQACINIDKSKGIIIDGLCLRDAGGDGIMIGGTHVDNCKNVEILHCTITGNRRNGVSIIGGVDGVDIHDCMIEKTGGTDPQLGIDIETWDSVYKNKNIRIYNNRFDENTNGDLTIFEYSSGVRVFNNMFKNVVSVKVNSQYNNITPANPTDLAFHDNVFEKNLYFYGICYGGFSITNNVYNGSGIMIESPFAVDMINTQPTESKLIKGNTFNGSSTAITCGYNAKIIIADNVANSCRKFFSAWGLFNSTIKGNLINGYNVENDQTEVLDFNGKVEKIIIERNRIIDNFVTYPVTRLIYFKGGSTFDNIIRDNDFSKAEFTAPITYDAQANNIDYGNAIPDCDNYCKALPTPSKKFAGMILSLVSPNAIYTYICTLVDGTYRWKDITSKL